MDFAVVCLFGFVLGLGLMRMFYMKPSPIDPNSPEDRDRIFSPNFGTVHVPLYVNPCRACGTQPKLKADTFSKYSIAIQCPKCGCNVWTFAKDTEDFNPYVFKRDWDATILKWNGLGVKSDEENK